MEERVVITGIGLVSPQCISTNSDEILEHISGEAHHETKQYIEDIAEKLEAHIPYKILRRICRFSQLALYSNVLCHKDSELKVLGENDQIGSIMNTSYGPLNVTEGLLHTLIERGPQDVSPADFSNTVNNCATGQVSITLGLKGVSTTLVGSSAICYGYDLIRNGKANAILVSGVEERNETIGDVAANKGHTVCESSSCILLESYTHAMSRKAKIYSEVVGCESFYLSSHNMEKVYEEKIQQYETCACVVADASVGERSLKDMFGQTNYLDTNKTQGTVFGATEVLNNLVAAEMISQNHYYTNTEGVKQRKLANENIISISVQQGGCCSIIVQSEVK